MLSCVLPTLNNQKLIALAQKLKCKFAGSTSSLTGILTQIYLLLSEEKHLNISGLSAEFDEAVSTLVLYVRLSR